MFADGDIIADSYRIERRIGVGGLATVYAARHVEPDLDPRAYALKVMSVGVGQPRFEQLFRREVRRMLSLDHPAVVRCHTVAKTRAGQLVLVMDYVEGPSLQAHVRRRGPLDRDGTLALARRLLPALSQCHHQGLIHRDLAPDNLLLRGGALDQAILIDFGIAKDMDGSLDTVVGSAFAGKLTYAAPEQFGLFGRQVGPWTDVYSFGLVLGFAATGQDVLGVMPSLSDALEARQGRPDLSAVPGLLQPVLAQALAPDPAHRPQSAQALLALVEHHLGTTPAPSTPAPPPLVAKPVSPTPTPILAETRPSDRPVPGKRSGPGWQILGAVVALGMVAGGVALGLPKGGAEPPPSASVAAATVPSPDPSSPAASSPEPLSPGPSLRLVPPPSVPRKPAALPPPAPTAETTPAPVVVSGQQGQGGDGASLNPSQHRAGLFTGDPQPPGLPPELFTDLLPVLVPPLNPSPMAEATATVMGEGEAEGEGEGWMRAARRPKAVREGPAEAPQALSVTAVSPPPTPPPVLRDGPGPPLRVIRPGSYFRPADPNRPGPPLRRVTVPGPLALAERPVLGRDWAACSNGGGCRVLPRAFDEPSAPVSGVSWADARAYVVWLRQVTGKPYRLPSEAEWGYLASQQPPHPATQTDVPTFLADCFAPVYAAETVTGAAHDPAPCPGNQRVLVSDAGRAAVSAGRVLAQANIMVVRDQPRQPEE